MVHFYSLLKVVTKILLTAVAQLLNYQHLVSVGTRTLVAGLPAVS